MISSKDHFTRRLQRMVDKECEVTGMETNIAHRSAKYYQTITELKTTIVRQVKDLEVFHHEVDSLRRQNERLEKFTREEEERLAVNVKKVQELQREYEEAMQRQEEQRKASLIKMDLIRKIKQTTQTYFNMDALPHKFQGVKVCVNETSMEWKPFVNDAKQWIQFLDEQLDLLKQKEMEGSIYNIGK